MIDSIKRGEDPAAYVQQVIDSWRANGEPNAKSALAQRPELRFDKNLVLDLIYEEFCLRKDQGEELAASTFFDDFPTLRHSIEDMLDVHVELEANPELAAKLAPPKVEWPQEGDVFRGYEIIRQLGKGSLARVYLAQNPELGERYVALKVSRNMQEAATAGRLDHQNVMDVNWVADDESRNATWMCMPFCGAATIRDVLDIAFAGGSTPEQGAVILTAAQRPNLVEQATGQRQPADAISEGSYIEACLHLGSQLASALQHAHERNILHRDLKPTNILVTTSGSPKLLDFNLSDDPNVEVHRLGGTLGYMAPEQINASFNFAGERQIDARSEVYAMGVILYELMTGQLPFGRPDLRGGAEHAAEMMAYRQAKWQPIAPSRINSRVSADVEKVLLRALEKDPDNRFQTATEMQAALDACQRRLETQRIHKNRGERRVVAAVGILGLLLIAFGFFMAFDDAANWTTATKRRKALDYLEEGRWRRTLDLIELIPEGELTEHDHEVLLYCYLASADENRAAFQGAILWDIDRDNPVYLNNYASALNNSDPTLAYSLICKAAGLAPDSPQIQRNFAKLPMIVLLKTGKAFPMAPSLRAVEAALELNEDDAGLHAAGSVYAAELGNDLLAYHHAIRAVELGIHISFYEHGPPFKEMFGPSELEALRAAAKPIQRNPFHDYVIRPSTNPELATSKTDRLKSLGGIAQVR